MFLPRFVAQVIAPLRARLKARGDSEHEQALLRIVIVGLVLGYMSSFHGSPTKWSAQDWTIILGLSGFFAVAIAYTAACDKLK